MIYNLSSEEMNAKHIVNKIRANNLPEDCWMQTACFVRESVSVNR